MISKVVVVGVDLMNVVISRWIDWEAVGFKFSDAVDIELPVNQPFSIGVGILEAKKAEIVKAQWSIRFDVVDENGVAEQDCLDAFYRVGTNPDLVVKGLVDGISDYVEFDKTNLFLSDDFKAELKKAGVDYSNGNFGK